MQHLLSDAPAMPGLLWAMRFDETGLGHLVPHGEPLPAPGEFGESFFWLHFNLNDARLTDAIAEGRFGPAHLAASAFGSDEHQRIAVEDGHIGGVVADLVQEFCPEANADAAGRLHFVMGSQFLVSGRRHPVLAPEAVREAAAEGKSMNAPIALLETLVSHVIASMAATGARLVDELDTIEDHILERRGRTRGERRRLGPIRRDAVRLHRQLLGLRAVFHRLEAADEDENIAPAAVKTASRIAQRLDALDRDMVMIADRSRLMQEEVTAHLAEESNRQIYTLSILTAVFLPPTLVTGLFGMNTKGLPLSDLENGSTIAIVIGVVSALAVFGVIRALGIRSPRE
ncbi:CorA family divalent cation transporter [Methylobacterium sp. C25]|uniref:CorA family divalent cation transporter n=1 Tax=Methylobacterium sp. C25 TaxID=2721622 RepID=UPI001F475467|nr:CorA family divalent cation transporter [Methylobacterium sp. C25]